ncbi:MAG: thioesterase [Microbacteriaceae bacterium]|nr:thioesterase [Microbacteriaceae bacterium]
MFRALSAFLRPRRSALTVHDTSSVNFRTWPTDIDMFGHMNNGVYFSILDHGRTDLLLRSGLWQALKKADVYPVVATETMTFRKSLLPWQRFSVETRVGGYDAKAVYIEHRVISKGEIYAQALVRSRFLRKAGGTVSIAEMGELTGVDITQSVPEKATRWAEDFALPSTREAAVSDWV